MKLAFISVVALAATVALPANAQGGITREKCKVLSEYADIAMHGRQNGADMADLLDRLSKAAALMEDPKLVKLLNNLFEAYVMEAYDLPRYSTEEVQQRSITDFKNAKHLECLRMVKDRE